MAPHSSTLAWKIPWVEEPGRLQSMGSLRVRHDWVTSLSLFTSCIEDGNGNPLQYSCLENPRDGGAWWAAVHGVANSQTRLSGFTFSFHFSALEKEMATHSSVLAWIIPGMGEPGGLTSMGSHRVRHDWSDLAQHHSIVHICWKKSYLYVDCTVQTCVAQVSTYFISARYQVIGQSVSQSGQLLSHVQLFATPWTAAPRLPCPSTTSRASSNSCPSSQWCYPTISSSVVPFSSWLVAATFRRGVCSPQSLLLTNFVPGWLHLFLLPDWGL